MSKLFITPLMEQQMFDDWCSWNLSPRPRAVWASAIDSVNGVLLHHEWVDLTSSEVFALSADISSGRYSSYDIICEVVTRFKARNHT
jgi:hypothetical protein